MLKSSFKMGDKQYSYYTNNDGDLFMARGGGGHQNTKCNVRPNGKVYCSGSFTSDCLDTRTLMAIAIKTFG